MKRERIVILVVVAVVYTLSFIAVIVMPPVAASIAAPARAQLGDLEPKLTAAQEALSSTGKLRDKAQHSQLQATLKNMRSQIATACSNQPEEGDGATILLDVTQRIQGSLAPGVTLPAYEMHLNGVQVEATATPEPSASPASAQGTNPAINALQDPNALADGANQVMRAITSGPSLALTFHGPFPKVMDTLDNLTHNQTAIAFSVVSVARTNNADAVDAKFNVTVDHVPSSACLGAGTPPKKPAKAQQKKVRR